MNINWWGYIVLQYDMDYGKMFVFYIRKRFGLEYKNKLMKCWVNIIYPVVICDSTYIIKIMKGLQ